MAKLTPFVMLTALLVSACSNPEKTGRYLIDAPSVAASLPNRLGRVEIRDVSLPQYASGQEIAYQTPDGALRSTPDNIWADDQVRAVTQFLATEIALQSGAQAIAEPWPFPERPQRRVEVRIEKIIARADGMFELSGAYFVSNEAAQSGVSRRFDVREPLVGEGPAAIAAAQSRALQKLAGKIASLSE
ncbi:MAG: PqiC family protein [Deltaproteobacteria bacterium]